MLPSVSSFFYDHRMLLSSVGFSLPPFCPLSYRHHLLRHGRSTASLQPHMDIVCCGICDFSNWLEELGGC
ncbi:hypothetical protein RchiOBHm_Chr1g0329031 [Rosa chinensis]|uniref:Uncharacterized protein n=1 Tax=Rosa chinensis TaxID=74649 RepID=A0A2P6SAW7_ROSCH|nr:hypothetical protein RchiOBHm_Chr1g0329031 [Rosa chinensis]